MRGLFNINLPIQAVGATWLMLAAASPVWGAAPDAARPDAAGLVHACAGCHGTAGQGGGSAPALARLSRERFLQAMADFRSGKRAGGAMNRIAPGYDEAELAAMAQFFGKH